MATVESALVSKWLGITNQQFDILRAIHRLQKKRAEAYPKDIREEYREYYSRDIKRPNLFNALKIMTENGLLEKDKKSRYSIDTGGVRNALDSRERTFLQEVSEFKKVSADVDSYLNDVSMEAVKPYVEYIDSRHTLFERITKQLERANTYYIVARFPGTAFTPIISRKGAERGRYLDVLYERCLERKELRIVYLTPLMIDYPFNYAMTAYRNKKLAERECKIVLDNLEAQVESTENLDVRYVENPFGFDILMTEVDEPLDFYIWVRDNRGLVVGGIYIRSPETALRAKERFLEVSKNSRRVKGPEGKRILDGIRKELKSRDWDARKP